MSICRPSHRAAWSGRGSRCGIMTARSCLERTRWDAHTSGSPWCPSKVWKKGPIAVTMTSKFFPGGAAALGLGLLLSSWAGFAAAASSSECTRIGVCYCINAELKPVIESRISHFRELAAQQRKAGKAVGYLSVPLSPAGGGYMNLNREVAESAKASIEQRFGADFVWVLNPAMPDADIPKGRGADYML